jgi:hypothetical protein
MPARLVFVGRMRDTAHNALQHLQPVRLGAPRWIVTMHGRIARKGPSRFDAVPEGVRVPADFHVMAQESVVRSRELYRTTMATAQGGAKVFAEVAETTWGSAKLLNDKIIQNVTANTEAAFNAAEAIAAAGSLPEAAKLQSDFLQQLFVTAGEQVKEFVDLSTRVAQHVLETMHEATTRSMQRDGDR